MGGVHHLAARVGIKKVESALQLYIATSWTLQSCATNPAGRPAEEDDDLSDSAQTHLR
jgi:hypothetical protein